MSGMTPTSGGHCRVSGSAIARRGEAAEHQRALAADDDEAEPRRDRDAERGEDQRRGAQQRVLPARTRCRSRRARAESKKSSGDLPSASRKIENSDAAPTTEREQRDRDRPRSARGAGPCHSGTRAGDRRRRLRPARRVMSAARLRMRGEPPAGNRAPPATCARSGHRADDAFDAGSSSARARRRSCR